MESHRLRSSASQRVDRVGSAIEKLRSQPSMMGENLFKCSKTKAKPSRFNMWMTVLNALFVLTFIIYHEMKLETDDPDAYSKLKDPLIPKIIFQIVNPAMVLLTAYLVYNEMMYYGVASKVLYTSHLIVNIVPLAGFVYAFNEALNGGKYEEIAVLNLVFILMLNALGSYLSLQINMPMFLARMFIMVFYLIILYNLVVTNSWELNPFN